MDLEPAVERLDPLLQPGQPAAPRVRAAGSVVGDLDHKHCPVEMQRHARTRARRMLGDVGQRLGNDKVGRGLDHRWETVLEPSVNLDVHRRPARQRLDRGDQTAIGEHGWRDAAREVPELPDRGGRLLAGLAHQRRAVGVIGKPLLRAPELHRERDQSGLRSIVQIALDPAELGCLNVERSAACAG